MPVRNLTVTTAALPAPATAAATSCASSRGRACIIAAAHGLRAGSTVQVRLSCHWQASASACLSDKLMVSTEFVQPALREDDMQWKVQTHRNSGAATLCRDLANWTSKIQVNVLRARLLRQPCRRLPHLRHGWRRSCTYSQRSILMGQHCCAVHKRITPLLLQDTHCGGWRLRTSAPAARLCSASTACQERSKRDTPQPCTTRRPTPQKTNPLCKTGDHILDISW